MMTVQQAFSLALQQHQSGRLADAESLYRQIVAVQPRHSEAVRLIGVIAYQAGRYDLAAEWVRQSIALNPNVPAAHANLGDVFREIGRLDDAADSYRAAIRIKPDYAEAHNGAGIILAMQGRAAEAVASFRRALESQPDYAEASNNLGIACKTQGRLDEAITAFRCAIQSRPDFQVALSNLGMALVEGGQLAEAVAVYRRCLEIQPDDAGALSDLGGALALHGQLEEAIAAFCRAIELQPRNPAFYDNLGLALTNRGQLDEALAAFDGAIQLNPSDSEAYYNRGNVLKEQGRISEAVTAYQEALRLKPNDTRTYSNLVYALHFHPLYDSSALAEAGQRWNREIGGPLRRYHRPHAVRRDPDRRIRLGYVSPEFRDHVIGRHLLPLFRNHDRGQFEIICYSGVVRPDESTRQFREFVHHWRSTINMSDENLSTLIREDEVDILVDLTQHLAGNRLPVFARRPAPVQVSFAGYPASTGLETIECRISDRWVETGESAGYERVFLIDSFWCYDPCGMEIVVQGLPAIRNGHITFGSLNNFCKVNERVLRLWARVLKSVEGSRLILLSSVGSHRQRTLELLEQEGVATERVDFVGPHPRRDYLELYHRLDIALDPFPYGGHTTSLDALWMGVPVVSLVGETSVSRAGLSILSNLGLPELIAHEEEEYAKIAAGLANDLARLGDLRSTLRSRMETSILMDAPGFARQIEAAYRAMWKEWCGKEVGE